MLTGFAGLSTPLVAGACIRRECRCALRRRASARSSPGVDRRSCAARQIAQAERDQARKVQAGQTLRQQARR